MLSPVKTVEETVLIDSSVMASFEVALAGIEIKLVIDTNEKIENHGLNFLNTFRPSSN
jgi:dsRNA-specific ribonuclease